MVHSCDPSSGKAETEGTLSLRIAGLHKEFKASLDYGSHTCLKHKTFYKLDGNEVYQVPSPD